jgi:hypothetical protein
MIEEKAKQSMSKKRVASTDHTELCSRRKALHDYRCDNLRISVILGSYFGPNLGITNWQFTPVSPCDFRDIEQIQKLLVVKIKAFFLANLSKEVGLEISVEKTVVISSAECRSKSGHKNSKQIVWKCVTVQIFGDNSNKSVFG